MACIPFSVKDLDIYALGNFNLSIASLVNVDSGLISDFPCSLEKYNAIPSGIVSYGDAKRTFEPQISWDLHSIASTCANWICDEDTNVVANSRVWILSSLNTQHSLSDLLGEDFSKALRLLVKISSIIYNWGDQATYSHYSSSDLWGIRTFAGSQVLRRLHATLTIHKLAKASQDELKAIFLVLFGTVIAVGYTGPSDRFWEVIVPDSLTSPRY